ncbi:MAG: peptidoglycan-associated lipoprotein Pal [Chlorobiaceae bacterium]|jgi:peptidoglycan-associated lipoprotein
MKRKINGIVILALMVTAGCSSKSAVTAPEVRANQAPSPKITQTVTLPTATAPSLPAPPSGYGFDQWQTGPLGDVFFDFDSTVLSAEAQNQLKQNGAWLGNNSLKGALIEGHCDSRGTSEYNLALGERRASTAKEYLVRLGVATSRLETVSFGEERPFDAGTGENAWAKNRRAHFVIKK